MYRDHALKTRQGRRAALFALGLLMGTAAGPAAADKNAALADSLQWVASTQQVRYQTANVFSTMTGPGTRLGAAWLERSRNGVRGRIMTNVPAAGVAYTLWVVIFNNPSACAGSPCAESDLGNPAVKASVFNGSGAISASNGNGGGVINFDFERMAGRLPNDLFLLFGEPRGLLHHRGFSAEIHLVVDQHPVIPAGQSWIADLTTTNFPGGGSAFNVAAAIFVPCPAASCPASVL